MKVGFAGVYRDMTGYGHAALEIIKSLDAAGLDVVTRPIRLTQCNETIPNNDFYTALEQKDLNGVDVMIQAYLPEFMIRNGRCKNVGHFFSETDNFRRSGWSNYLNLMDAVCVSTQDSADACADSGVTQPVWNIPLATDITKYSRQYPELDLPGLDGKYVFYSIGDYSTRKNYQQLIRAYLSGFTRDDNVVLVLKTFIAGRNAQDSYNIITAEIEEIKRNLRLHRVSMWPPIILICDRLTEDEIMGLHTTGDCFIIAEHGSGWGIPAFDAAGMGKQVIAPSIGGHTTFLNQYNRSFPIESRYDLCPGVTQAECPYNLYTGHELWATMTTQSIVSAMWNARNNAAGSVSNPGWINAYSYTSVGAMWKTHLENLCV
jgi:glycosyltransferase involved in cell wall biosynthesis